MIPPFVFRLLYWYMNKLDIHHHVTFMNYGYSEPGETVLPDSEDEKDPYCLQLYRHLIKEVDFSNKNVVDVGSGRGGGSSYIARSCCPASVIGIDRTRASVNFSTKKYCHTNLSFMTGDALKLPLKNSSCDILLNVESSHLYRSMELFFKEVSRVLRPGGHFLFADFRYATEWTEISRLLNNAGLMVLRERDITSNILYSLDLDSERRISLVRKYAPRILRKSILNFTGSRGTDTYNKFLTREYTYRSFTIRKQLVWHKTSNETCRSV